MDILTRVMQANTDGYLIDKMNVYEAIGRDKFIELSTAFYNRVYSDDEDKFFREQFANRPIEGAIQNQYEFFIQRMGGPQLYSERKRGDRWGGHPALRARHAPFVVNTANADRWLHHMHLALDDVKITGEVREAMWQFFRDVAYFLRNAREPAGTKGKYELDQ